MTSINSLNLLKLIEIKSSKKVTSYKFYINGTSFRNHTNGIILQCFLWSVVSWIMSF